MTNKTPNWHPAGRTLAEDLALLTAGQETGWWDENERPAPWPENFLNPDADRTNPAPHDPNHTEPDNAENPY